MDRRYHILFLLLAVLPLQVVHAQHATDFGGQLSVISSFAPDNQADVFLGARLIPELNHEWKIDSSRKLVGEASLYTSSAIFSESLENFDTESRIDPYRVWLSYRKDRLELRAGLQKIDFGSAKLLRPLQWFNQIDPRDPLQLTNGVYGLLGRYYFRNNANIWFWALYGNERTRSFDAVGTNSQVPEFGGRLQLPTKKGEIALSFHQRTASTAGHTFLPAYDKIPEQRVGIEGKWDLGVGLWFELAYVRKHKDLDVFTHQTLLNIGVDYTLPIGNGLGVTLEHLTATYDQSFLAVTAPAHITATLFTYPLSLFGSLSTVGVYSWEGGDVTFQLNYAHQFPKWTGYVMLFQNPAMQLGIQNNELVSQFQGPGIRLMVVKNW